MVRKGRESNEKGHKQDQWTDAGKPERAIQVSSREVEKEFEDATHRAPDPGTPADKLNQHRVRSTRLNVDAVWDSVDSGEDVAEPDQDIVEEFAEAVGLVYQDNEPLHTTEKVERRDRERWELDPASSEDYEDRIKPHRPPRPRTGKRS